MGPTKPDKLLRRPFSDEPIAKYGAETHIQPRARDRHLQDRFDAPNVEFECVSLPVPALSTTCRVFERALLRPLDRP